MRVDRAIAPVLALWLSGVCCLLLCVSVCAESAAASSAKRGCCARGVEIDAEASCDGPAIAGEGQGAGGACCFLSSRPMTNAPLPDGSQAPVAASATSSAPVAVATAPVAPAFVAAPLARNRGDTYLRCCVFLI